VVLDMCCIALPHWSQGGGGGVCQAISSSRTALFRSPLPPLLLPPMPLPLLCCLLICATSDSPASCVCSRGVQLRL